jgi:hypothetical protein
MTKREHALKVLGNERIHLDPNALSSLPNSLQNQFECVWTPVESLLELLEPFPAGLLNWWLGIPNGHIVISSLPSSYNPGELYWRTHKYTSIAYISPQDLLGSGKVAFLVTMRMLNHLFGSGGEQDNAYFSQGFGLTPKLAEAALQYVSIEQLQYGHSILSITSASDYLAETLWLALQDRQSLNRIDPLLEKLYYRTLLSERFWSR